MNPANLTSLDLTKYQQIVILTGAGVSVASGLPTYRGRGGLWTTTEGESLARVEAVEAAPERVWNYFGELRRQIAQAVPNEAHLAIARAERALRPDQRMTVLTQNIDGLHALAGSHAVLEMHGTIRRSRCTKCEHARVEELTEAPPECPTCPNCSAYMRPDVVLFGEPLPVEAEWQAKKALRDCDLFIAAGTSGTVSPASSFVRAAEYAGARTIYVNLEPMTPANPAFKEVYLGPAEDLLPKLLATERVAGETTMRGR